MSSKSPDELSAVRKTKKAQNFYRDYASFLTLGFQLAATVVLFFLIGHWVDKQFEIEPIGKLIGVLLGSVGGFIKFFKTVSSIVKKEKKD